MPVTRLTRRRRSSLGIALSTPVKPGMYGIASSPRAVTFAPNVTPGTYIEETSDSLSAPDSPASPATALFPPAPPTTSTAPSTSRRRAPPGKRRSQGYIPRPPNAFMLFRANFVRQKHVPGSIETNHGSLSKIIGNCWKALPDPEKRVWEARAKKAKAEHREMYPNYRFRPVHNKEKRVKVKQRAESGDERRCEEVAQLLLEGKKGDELAAAVRRLDLDRARDGSPMSMPMHAPVPMGVNMNMGMGMGMQMYAQHRRSSSVPPPSLYHPIAIPSMPFFLPHPPPPSNSQLPSSQLPSSHQPQQHDQSLRMLYGARRASSAEPRYYDAWMLPSTSQEGAPLNPADLQPDNEPLPDVDDSLFNPSYLGLGGAGVGFGMGGGDYECDPNTNPTLALQISPLTHLDPTSIDPTSTSSATNSANDNSPWSTPATSDNSPWSTPASALTTPTPMPWYEYEYKYDGHSNGHDAFSVTPPPSLSSTSAGEVGDEDVCTPPDQGMHALQPHQLQNHQLQNHQQGLEHGGQEMFDMNMNMNIFQHQLDMNIYHQQLEDPYAQQQCLDPTQIQIQMGMGMYGNVQCDPHSQMGYVEGQLLEAQY